MSRGLGDVYKRQVEIIEGIYIDQLITVIDNHVEKVDNYKERVEAEYSLF